MCNGACIDFVKNNTTPEEILNRRILEVGAYNVNGSVRNDILKFNPKEYNGIDITPGPGVDSICDVYDIITKYGKESYDVVISTEMLEHVEDWTKCISNLKNVITPGGLIYLTTRSIGFGKHNYPYDWWRYQKEDMEYIFSDFEIQKIEIDPCPGIFIKAKKPINYKEKDLSLYRLYNINTGAR